MEEREQWASRAGFVMAAIGSAVGLGNLWRFPYICYANGGGAFLIPYFVALFTAGIPLMILEYGLGNMMRGSAPRAFQKIDKKWEWIGWWAILVGFIITTYYSVVIAWSLDYILYSLKMSWGDKAKDFFFSQFLGLSESPFQVGGIRIPILIGLAIIWGMIYLIIYKGVLRVGKVVFLTVPLPIILLLVLFFRGITLPGAMEGIKYYLTPNFKLLMQPRVWLAAYSQIFFSLSLGFGILIAYASYLPRKSDITNNAFITSLANCGTSFFAGFAVFTVLGYLAHISGSEVGEVVKGGPGLAFVVYPTAIRLLPVGAVIFGMLFFILLISLGIDSAFSLVEAIVAGGMDKWGFTRKKATLGICILGFLGGLIFTTRSGLYWLDIIDDKMNNFGLAPVGLAECLIIGYFFGTKKFRERVNKVSEIPLGIWWDICIKFVTPIILAVSIILVLRERIRIPYENYPRSALLIGWGVVFLILALSFLFMRMKGRES